MIERARPAAPRTGRFFPSLDGGGSFRPPATPRVASLLAPNAPGERRGPVSRRRPVRRDGRERGGGEGGRRHDGRRQGPGRRPSEPVGEAIGESAAAPQPAADEDLPRTCPAPPPPPPLPWTWADDALRPPRRAAPALAHSTTVALCLPPPPPAPPPLPAPARFQRRTRHRPRSAVGRLGSPASRRPLRPQRSPPCPRCNSSGVPLPLCRALPRSVRSARCARPLGPLYPLGRPHRPARPASTRLRRPTSVTSRRQACSKATTRRI